MNIKNNLFHTIFGNGYAPIDSNWRYTHPRDVKVLLSLIDTFKCQNVIEFGVQEGLTARTLLSRQCIKWYVGVEVPQTYNLSAESQKGEIPEEAGKFVLNDYRFSLYLSEKGTEDLDTKKFPKFDLCFIDADHSYEGVKRDTQIARNLVKTGGIIVWHDYSDHEDIGVKKFIDEENAKKDKILVVEDTWCCVEFLK